MLAVHPDVSVGFFAHKVVHIHSEVSANWIEPHEARESTLCNVSRVCLKFVEAVGALRNE